MKIEKCVGLMQYLPVGRVVALYAFVIWAPFPLIAENDPFALAARQAAMAKQIQQPKNEINEVSDKEVIQALRMLEKEGKPILDRKDNRYRELLASVVHGFASSPLDFQKSWQRIADTNTPSEWRSMVIECSPVLLPVLSVAPDDSLRHLASVIGSGAEPMVKSAAIGASEAIITQMFTNPDSRPARSDALSGMLLKTCATLTQTIKQLGNANAQGRKRQIDLLVTGLSSMTRILRYTQYNSDEIRLAVSEWGAEYQKFDFESTLCFIRLLKYGLGETPDDAVYNYAISIAETTFDKKRVQMIRDTDWPSQGERGGR